MKQKRLSDAYHVNFDMDYENDMKINLSAENVSLIINFDREEYVTRDSVFGKIESFFLTNPKISSVKKIYIRNIKPL